MPRTKLNPRCDCGQPAVTRNNSGDSVCRRCLRIEHNLAQFHEPMRYDRNKLPSKIDTTPHHVYLHPSYYALT